MTTTPFGIVSDIHLHNWSAFSSILPTGENDRLMIILNALLDSAKVMADQGCQRMYIAGDLFHERGKITPSVLNPTLRIFKLITELLEVRLIPGNHDLESDDSKELTNATQALESLGVIVVTKPTYFADDEVAMFPWEPSLVELRKVMSKIQGKFKAKTAIIHAPLNGVIPGIPDHGLEANDLARLGFNKVFCGHYHNRKDFGNGVWSIGALTHQTWNDVNTGAGYLIVNGDDVEPFITAAPKFVDYDDKLGDKVAAARCKGNYVRAKLGEATEKEIQVIRELIKTEFEAKGVIVHAMPKRDTTTRKSTIEAGASMETSVHEFVDSMETKVDKAALNRECIEVLAETNTGEDD